LELSKVTGITPVSGMTILMKRKKKMNKFFGLFV